MIFRILLLAVSITSLLNASCSYDLNINFDFENQKIEVKADILNQEKKLQLDTLNFKIKDTNKLKESLKKGTNQVSFTYTKTIKDLNKNYIYLLNNWYPKINSKCKYSIKTSLANTYSSIYEDVNKQLNDVSFIASDKFVIQSKIYDDITISTYLLKNDQQLSQKYLEKTIEYIKLYKNLIGNFPYKKFTIVENIHSTGYSMPTYTLIGSRLLNKPYILNQSLGHEILHQYFGNSIFNDSKKGNWVEGLTTYLADDYYKKLLKEDINHRKIILNEYENFVKKDNEFAINKFEYRYDKSSMLIGYSKLSFIFHMLEEKIGSEEFERLIKKFYLIYKFKEINLKELGIFFDNNSSYDLKEFFKQWFNQKGMISFDIQNLDNYYDKNGFWVSFDIIQKEKNFFKFDLPLNIKTYDKEINTSIKVNKTKQKVKLNFSSEILELTFDKNISLFRELSKEEKQLSISSIMTEKSLITVVDKQHINKYQNIKKIFPNAKILTSNELKFKDIKENTIVFLDSKNELLPHFFPDININKTNTYLSVKAHIYNNSKQMAVLNFGEYKKRYLMMLKHYSKYKEIIFTKNKIEKNMHKTDYGIKIELNKIPSITKIQNKRKIKDTISEITNNRIIYVGENHDVLGHHLNQLRVIKELYQSGKKIAIGMEMFQAPFQKHIDEYIKGNTSLEEFLKNTQYFKRWKFDYNLYKPILDYTKENKIPVIALNIDRQITQQVSKKGLLSLNDTQKNSLPTQIDQSNLQYKKSLEEIFNNHTPKNSKNNEKKKDGNKNTHTLKKINHDFFYQSQLIWDEIMAENIHKYVKDNKDTTFVVIAGEGHIQGHKGIPSRVFRRNSMPYKIILNDYEDSKVGDFVLVNKSNTNIKKPNKLGVYLKSSYELIALDTVKGSFSNKIGLKKNDKILELNGKEVKTLYDLKRVLYFMDNLNDSVLKVKREGKVKELKIK